MKTRKENYEQARNFYKNLIPGVDKFMDDIKSKIGPYAISALQGYPTGDLEFIEKIFNFRLKLVIDNNIIFAEINGLIKGKKEVENCFFYQLALSPAIDFFAPPFLKEEIFEKIEQKFPKSKKPKAIEFAKKLLSAIKIKEASWVEDWIKAKRKIGHRDEDDIPYLALCFDLKSHGVMSNDKIFSEEQNEVKAWTIGETGRVSAEFEEGAISFYFLGHIANLGTYIGRFLGAFFTAIIELIGDFLSVIVTIFKGGVSAISKIPSKLLLLFGGLSIIAYLFVEEVRDGVNDTIEVTRKFIIDLLQQLKVWFEKFYQFSIELFELLKPHLKNAGGIIAYLTMNSALTVEIIKEIENFE